MQQTIECISQAMDIARRKFTAGEQSMLLDIFNGTFLTPGILGQHLIAQVEDSFELYPGTYEEKWGVDKTVMLEKIRSLDRSEAALIELWAVVFWQLDPQKVEEYITGKLNMGAWYAGQIESLRSISDRLEKTKGSFKSAEIANCRTELDQTITHLEG